MKLPISLFVLVGVLAMPYAQAIAQTGVSDDRVSLPEGPGSLEGIGENVEMDVNMGNMRHSIPIDVPAGFGAVTPSLSLSYSSGGGNGVVGMGWSMSTSHIERMTYRGLPQYQTNDDFSADGGDQLVRLPGTNPPQYRSRFEKGFVRYTWIDDGAGDEGYWVAEYPNGSKGYFGARADGTLVEDARMGASSGTFRYMLVEKVDVYGHTMKYRYTKFGVVPLLTNISYVFQNPQAPNVPTYEVELSYEERIDDGGVDYLSDAKPGFDELLSHRLKHIDVYSRNVRIRRYRLTYEAYTDSGGFTRLSKVETIGQQEGVYPAVQSFSYSKALGGLCGGGENIGCQQPFMVGMGQLPVSISSGRATLLDINGDGLPDIIDSSENGPHRFFINTLNPADGTQSFSSPTASRLQGATGASFRLGIPGVQVLDANGDGYTDIVNAVAGEVLYHKGQVPLAEQDQPDWAQKTSMDGTSDIATALGEDVEQGELQSLRFMDYNNDKRIDIIKSTTENTIVYENQGADGFEIRTDVQQLGVGFAQRGVQLTDMNGDGLLDVVRVTIGQLSYWLNLGWGQWANERIIQGLPITDAELDIAQLEDLNGDGLADLVVVSGGVVKYALNRNGTVFSSTTSLTTNHVQGDLPNREEETTVLFADMNGNGSTDIVWVGVQGDVQFVEMFPVRPNMMSTIENGLGQVTEVTYATSVEQMMADGNWQYTLPHPMQLVTSVDKYDLLTNVHEVTNYRYKDGYFDGHEKQFRGYQRVNIELVGDDTQQPGLTTMNFDVGAGQEGLQTRERTRPYYNGLLLSQTVFSDGRELSETTNTYDECDVAQIPAGTDWSIKHICQTESQTTFKEGLEQDRWVITESSMEYDGYGNITRSIDHGVTSIGGQACEPCNRDAEEFGKPCGAQCLGDEVYGETDYIEPGEDTSGRWIVGTSFRERMYGRPGSDQIKESLTYYDGDDFVGMNLGSLDKGNVTRVTQKVEVGSDEVIEAVRNAYDDHGNVLETLDPNGEIGEHRNRRKYIYDTDNLRVAQAHVLLEDFDGNPYVLRRDVSYEPLFDKMEEATDWMRIVEDRIVSSRRSFNYLYDEFGRLLYRVLPGGDTVNSPTETYAYELGNPTSRIITKKRTEVGGEQDQEMIRCMDGRGRTYQTRIKLEDGLYQVDGFVVFNVRAVGVRKYQPYTSTSPECDNVPPANVLSSKLKYDAAHRIVEAYAADESIYVTPSISRTVYEPLVVLSFDPNDTDPTSVHFDTPTVIRVNGQGRITSLERHLEKGGEPATIAPHYDSLGRMTGYADPGGNRKEQEFDLLGRLTRLIDPNSAHETRYQFDDAGNLIRKEDDRGVVTLSLYDGFNRKVAAWDEDKPEETRINWNYDFDGECEVGQCINGEGKVVSLSYPGDEQTQNTQRYGYDLRGRLIYNKHTLMGYPFEFRMQYDNANRLTGTTYPNGRTIERIYDDANRLVGIDGVVHTIEYDERSQMSGMDCADGSGTNIEYDDIMRPTKRITTGSQGEVLQGFSYTRDRVGNILAIEDDGYALGQPSYGASYSYDAWYRLLQAQMGVGSDNGEVVSYAFDLLDNITSITNSNPDASTHLGSFGYDSFAPNGLTSIGELTYERTEAGHMRMRGEQTMDWDFMDRMTEVFKGDERVARFMYGPNQSRVAKVEGDSTVMYPSNTFEVRDGISTLYVKLAGKRVARIEDDTLTTALLTDWKDDGQINAADAWLSHTLTQEPASGPLLWSSVRRVLMEAGPQEKITYLHHNHINSITLATAQEGEHSVVVGRRSFYPLGQVREEVGYVDEYGFTGQELDHSTGLLHFDWRYYDPLAGRWASIDPLFAVATADNIIRLGESTTAYNYVAGNFINAFDPTGTSAVLAAIVTVLLVAVVIRIPKFFQRSKAPQNRRILTADKYSQTELSGLNNVQEGYRQTSTPGSMLNSGTPEGHTPLGHTRNPNISVPARISGALEGHTPGGHTKNPSISVSRSEGTPTGLTTSGGHTRNSSALSRHSRSNSSWDFGTPPEAKITTGTGFGEGTNGSRKSTKRKSMRKSKSRK